MTSCVVVSTLTSWACSCLRCQRGSSWLFWPKKMFSDKLESHVFWANSFWRLFFFLWWLILFFIGREGLHCSVLLLITAIPLIFLVCVCVCSKAPNHHYDTGLIIITYLWVFSYVTQFSARKALAFLFVLWWTHWLIHCLSVGTHTWSSAQRGNKAPRPIFF